MAQLIEGQFQGRAVKGTAKIGQRGGKVIAVAELEVLEGEHKGKRFNFEGKLDDRAIKYTKRNLMALGWTGKKSSTLTADVDGALEKGLTVPFEVEIATWNKDDGTVRQWSTIRSIGKFQPKLDDIDRDKAAEVDSWFADVPDEGQAQNDIPF
jgi:hypothetical protein